MPHIRSIIFLALLFATPISLQAQELTRQDSIKTALEYLQQAEEVLAATKAEDLARDQMEIAADLDPTNLKANYRAGELRINTVNKSLAVKFFLRVFKQDPSYRFDIEYWIARSYQYGEQFDKALEFYNLYLSKLKSKPNYQGKDKILQSEVDRRIFESQNGKEYLTKPGKFSIVNIGREINSEFEDYAPVLNEAEDEIVFTSRRQEGNLSPDVFDDNKYYEDIFIAKKNGSKWSTASNIGSSVNTPYHDSNLALSSDGNTLFIYSDDNKGDIFYSERKNGQWSEPIPLPGLINSSYEENSITISKDGNVIYFSSDRPGGYGKLDIYKASKDSKGEWSAIKNLGPKINTDVDDSSPFIDYDLRTLYFSTKGRKGMGGYDIFKSSFSETQNGIEWSEPENVGYPINTPDDDVFYVRSKDGKRAYYSSVREDGLGYTDIYMITDLQPPTEPKEPVIADVPKKDSSVVVEVKTSTKEPIANEVKEPTVVTKPTVSPTIFNVKVVSAGQESPIDSRITLKGLRDNVIVPMTTTGIGEYSFAVESAKDYRLSVEAEGYSFQNINVKLEGASPKPKTINRKVSMQKLQVGSVSVLRNIYFDFGKASFTTEAYPELNKIVSMMQQNTGLSIEISGHTDSYGSNAMNLQLSKRRAEAVKDYLVKQGIDVRKVTASGYGESKPLVSNDDETEGREINRRVEFKVLKN